MKSSSILVFARGHRIQSMTWHITGSSIWLWTQFQFIKFRKCLFCLTSWWAQRMTSSLILWCSSITRGSSASAWETSLFWAWLSRMVTVSGSNHSGTRCSNWKNPPLEKTLPFTGAQNLWLQISNSEGGAQKNGYYHSLP